jgi:predicted nucleotide-binding protein
MGRKKFNVIIMHGRSREYLKIKKLLLKMEFNAVVLMEKFSGGTIIEKVRNSVWDQAHCAVILMSPDDQTTEKELRARQNVVFELGYCLGAFDSIPDKYWYNAVVIVKEERVERFADIEGMEYLSYRKKLVSEDLDRLQEILEQTFKKAKKYYFELK